MKKTVKETKISKPTLNTDTSNIKILQLKIWKDKLKWEINSLQYNKRESRL